MFTYLICRFLKAHSVRAAFRRPQDVKTLAETRPQTVDKLNFALGKLLGQLLTRHFRGGKRAAHPRGKPNKEYILSAFKNRTEKIHIFLRINLGGSNPFASLKSGVIRHIVKGL